MNITKKKTWKKIMKNNMTVLFLRLGDTFKIISDVNRNFHEIVHKTWENNLIEVSHSVAEWYKMTNHVVIRERFVECMKGFFFIELVKGDFNLNESERWWV